MVTFNDKVIIITGASSGIGAACAKVLSSAGAYVVLAARNEQRLQEVADTLPGPALVVPADVSIEESCRNLIDKTIEHYGRLDVLICNAGISMRSLFTECDTDVLRRVMNTNFWGTVYCTKYALPHLLATKGSLAGVSSIAGFMGLPARTGYSASKYAMQGFLETLRVETMKDGLHVLIACPGFTASNIRKSALNGRGEPQGESPRDESKMMTAEEVADAIMDAIATRKRKIILTSKGRLAVQLRKFFPTFIDRMLYREMRLEPDSPLK